VVAALRSASFDDIAADLEEWLKRVMAADDSESRRAMNEIVQRCNVRWLGDLYLPEWSGTAWWDMLERLSRAVKQYERARFR
jgi:hypothetical protein